MFKLSQETIAIVSVGATLTAFLAALAAIVITLNSDMRAEARADRAENQAAREAIRAENRADREAFDERLRAEREALDKRLRADREALDERLRADREAFEKHITRLTQEQGRVAGIVEQMRTASAQ